MPVSRFSLRPPLALTGAVSSLVILFLCGGPAPSEVVPDSAASSGGEYGRACAKCHPGAVASTPHPTTVNIEVREGNVAKYAAAMGGTDTCVSCHASVATEQSGEGAAARALECRQCHGNAAVAPANVHARINGKFTRTPKERKARRPLESAEARAGRWRAAKAAGMRLATDPWDLSVNCYQCHVVQNEALVAAGHSEGTRTFELVAGCGTYPHNFLIPAENGSLESAGASSLAVAYGLSKDAPARRRQLYMVGQLSKLHVGLGTMARVSDRKSKVAKFAINNMVKKAALELVSIRSQAGDAAAGLDGVIAALRSAGVLVEKSGQLKFCKSSVARDPNKVTPEMIEAVRKLIEPTVRKLDAGSWSFVDASIKTR